MQLPVDLQLALEQEVQACSMQELQRAARQMSEQYRSGKDSKALFLSPAACLAYLMVRMPATYAAIRSVLDECFLRSNWQPRSMVDIGAGPGTGGWAAMESFPLLESICFVEPSRSMSEIGQRLSRQADQGPMQRAVWKERAPYPAADLALLSYCVAEMTASQRNVILETLWKQETPVIAIIEPGTPAGFQRILQIREQALGWGAQIIAPCTHALGCPMEKKGWCHFPARVERTRLHKLLKTGTLGYEDEKFSYLVIGKNPIKRSLGRVVGSSKKNSGFVKIPLCSEGQLKEIVVSRKQDEYRLARKIEYGDAWM
ncbi:MAG: putative methyltransferase [Parachlamydiales bacterium]|nr:putative methyltransferase [Parachlamydiales bacterium]